jgi:CDGSH-type Zn-finger protein
MAELATFLAATGVAIWALQVRVAGKLRKYTCDPAGGDCPCHAREGSRPPHSPSLAGPLKVAMVPGTAVWLCTCGQSQKYPLCDGSHRAYNAAHGTSFVPKKFEKEEAGDVFVPCAPDACVCPLSHPPHPRCSYLCTCGHSANGVTCDGTHRKVALAKA